ncbi:MAG: methylenetetrahydrofolate reductase [Candidatus Helarchaeota archaeon]
MVEYYSKLMEQIMEGKFCFTGELEPAKTTNPEEVVHAAKEMIGSVIASNVTDGPQAMAYMNSMVASYHVLKGGMEPVYQLTCRDRNRIALIADLLGAYSLGIRNVLTLTGDHSGLGDTPDAMPVFDVDSGQLAMIAKTLMKGYDLWGNPVHDPPKFWIGGAGNPNNESLEEEIMKIQRKAHVLDFIQTQVIYSMDLVEPFMEGLKNTKNAYGRKMPVLIGVFPMKTYGIAKYFNDFIPGVKVPEDLLARFKKIKDELKGKENKKARTEAYADLNVEFFVPFIKEIKKSGAAGCHMMAVEYPDVVKRIIDEVLK